MKACCKKFEKLRVSYDDLVSNDDHSLQLLAGMLIRIPDIDPLTGDEIRSVGYEIAQYLNRKIVRENFIFGRPLSFCTFDEIDQKLEMKRVSIRLQID